MFKLLLLLFTLSSIYGNNIPSLPYCPDDYQNGLVLVSTLDGKISALNMVGSLVWNIDTGNGPLLLSNIHDMELTNNGEWIRIIPSLTGTLYKFDGSTIDPIPISAEDLLKSSFLYSSDLVVAGGIEITTYGVGLRTGTLFYECSSIKCSSNGNNDDDVLLVERSTKTIRAVEPRTGIEKWNFCVGLHNIKLPRVSCISDPLQLNWNITAVIPEGKIFTVVKKNHEENKWTYVFPSPIVRIWTWNGKDLSEVNVFSLNNIQQMTRVTFPPSLYLGMHNRQLYIHESLNVQIKVEELLKARSKSDVIVTSHTSITKIPWKPIKASTNILQDDATALSVLNGSDYVDGHGFYLYIEDPTINSNTIICSANNSFIRNITNHKTVKKIKDVYTYFHFWWKELFLLITTIIIFHMLFKYWNQHYKQKEIIIIEKPVEAHIVQAEMVNSKEAFTSRFENDFETIKCLGKGGFGVVFEVKQKYDECKYAIKRITLPKEKQSRDRVMREVKALAKLEHQHIVRYFGSWLEHPPLGWYKEHDEKWLRKDHSSYVDGILSLEKVKRSRSVSICIDIPSHEVESDINNDNGSDDDDDSFIVFEHSQPEEDKSQNGGKPSLVNENKQGSTTNKSVSSGESAISSMTMSDHLKKKINWKKPGRKHCSWDLSCSTSIRVKQQTAPIYLYIQMQLCREQSLKDWLVLHKERNYKQVIDFFTQILEAVEYVHHRGLIHRDLKPSNIFFSLDGQIKVGDFGLVKDVEDNFDFDLIRKGSFIYPGHTVEVGTQLYMSPEQFQSRIYDNKVDIYSLGLIFFELLIPFTTEMERIKKLSDVKQSKYPCEFSKKYPDEYLLLQNMLCENPSKRLAIMEIKCKSPFNRQDSGYSDK